MRRYCFIGNSQITAVKLGWNDVSKDYPETSIVFFGAQGGDLNALRRNGKALVANREAVANQFAFTAGKTSISVEEYDGFALFCGFGFPGLANSFARHRTSIDNSDETLHIVSTNFAKELVRERLTTGITMKVVKLLRSISGNAPIIVCPAPMPSEAILKENGFWRDIEQFYTVIADSWNDVALELAGEHRLKIVKQPEATLSGRFTAEEFSRDSVRLLDGFETKHTAADTKHMNAKFGALALPPILDALIGYNIAKP